MPVFFSNRKAISGKLKHHFLISFELNLFDLKKFKQQMKFLKEISSF